MHAFADLIDSLVYTRSRNDKIAMIAEYLRATPDPDRGWALAALAGNLDLPEVKSSAIRNMAMARFDPELFRMSRDYVGDTAETVALLWPDPPQSSPSPSGEGKGVGDVRQATVGESPPPTPPLKGRGLSMHLPLTVDMVIRTLFETPRARAPDVLAAFMDRLDANGRYALLKLATGGLRVGISARLAKTAVAEAFTLPVDEVEEVWHLLKAPYTALFEWGEGKAERPDPADRPHFRPFMLAHPLGDDVVDLADYAAEWKWDGIRIQIVATELETRLYSRGGEDITGAFPEVASAFTGKGVCDGELLVKGEVQGGQAASFNALQQRLGRKTVSDKMLAESPAFVCLYDLLIDGDQDIRSQPWHARRARLETYVRPLEPATFTLSEVLDAADFEALGAIRAGARDAAIEGMMLKRRDSPYLPGRKVGQWYKWKRDPLTADCVMMYAQRGSGKRSSFYSDYTFGCWTEDGQLLPVGKAYSGFTDEELKWLDKFVRTNTMGRFGPVREVEKSLVLEVAFDSIHQSKRHKSGLAMRFPRISRIRRDKPANEADRIASLQALVS
jgi:DNA ligase 1